MAKLTLITAGDAVITADELRFHLRIGDPIEDKYLETLIETAQKELELANWTQFTTTTFDQYFDAWIDPLILLQPPLISIVSLKYIDTDGTLQTVADTVYEAGEVIGVGTIRRKFNQNWPTDKRSHEDTIVAQFTCGYADTPAAIKHRVKLYCGHLYWKREPTDHESNIIGGYTYKAPTR